MHFQAFKEEVWQWNRYKNYWECVIRGSCHHFLYMSSEWQWQGCVWVMAPLIPAYRLCHMQDRTLTGTPQLEWVLMWAGGFYLSWTLIRKASSEDDFEHWGRSTGLASYTVMLIGLEPGCLISCIWKVHLVPGSL